MPVPSSSSRVTVVIVAYNSEAVLPATLASIPEGVTKIVVDNASTSQDTIRQIATDHDATLVENKKNLGFGVACNLGADQAETEFVFFLNPDCRLEEGCIDALVAAADKYPTAVAFNPKVATEKGKPDFKRKSVLLPAYKWLPRGWPSQDRTVPILGGAALFVRRDSFETVRGFDFEIFLYHEDDDISLRLARIGELRFVGDARATHLGGHGSVRNPQTAAFKAFQMGRSRVYATAKHTEKPPVTSSVLSALAQRFAPWNMLSERKRAKQAAFLAGVWSARRDLGHGYAEYIKSNRGRPPLWKVKREIIRLFRSPFKVSLIGIEGLRLTRRYDQTRESRITVTDGAIANNGEVGIYLIFPNKGVLESHIWALEAMREAGVAPLVVSNLPLSDSDKSRLKDHSWQILERPNVGYDFGGYRDAIWWLRDDLKSLKRLFVLNDSVWLLPFQPNWFLKAKEIDKDFVGATSNYGTPRVGYDNFRYVRWSYSTSHPSFHYASYAWCINPGILKENTFEGFWAEFKLSDDKTTTVNRGEIGFSQWVISKGFSHADTCPVFELEDELKALDDNTLRTLVARSVVPEERGMKKIKNELRPHESMSRNDAIAFLLSLVSRQAIVYSMPSFTIPNRGFGFLKKSPFWLDEDASAIMGDLVSEFPDPYRQVIASEAAPMIERLKAKSKKGDGDDK